MVLPMAWEAGMPSATLLATAAARIPPAGLSLAKGRDTNRHADEVLKL